MPSVNISFLGVCTIFQDLRSLLPPGVEGPKHRVVLVRNTPFMQNLSGIHPHIPKLQLLADSIEQQGPDLPPADPPEKNTFSLDGVTLTVHNPGNNPDIELSLGCLPSLQGFLDPEVELGPIAEFVYVPNNQRAAAWFDLDVGTSWEGFRMTTKFPCDTVPAISILTIETSSAPQLRVTPWNVNIEPTTFTLSNENGTPPNVFVMNFANGEAVVDSDRDFLLNYQCAASLPVPIAQIPRQDQVCTNPSPIVYDLTHRCGDAGPGCSNTSFP